MICVYVCMTATISVQLYLLYNVSYIIAIRIYGCEVSEDPPSLYNNLIILYDKTINFEIWTIQIEVKIQLKFNNNYSPHLAIFYDGK